MDWPETYEAWLYDYLYNATRLGYNRSGWGGRLIETDDPAMLVNANPDNLTVPVFVAKALELTDADVDAVVSRFFPDVNLSAAYIKRRVDDDGITRDVTVRFGSERFRLERNWRFEYHDEWPTSSEDRFGSNESAMEHAIGWLRAHNAWPDDVGPMYIRRWINHTAPGAVVYSFTAHRRALGFDFERGDFGSWINLQFEAATGRVYELLHCWPELEVPFVATDLPPIEEVISYHDMGADPARNITTWHSDNVTFQRASAYFDLGVTDSAPVFIFLPYWYLSQHMPGSWYGNSGHFGAIFPDKMMMILY